MGLLGKLANLTIDIATTPIAVAIDVVTLGGAVNDTGSRIVGKANQIAEDLIEIKDELKK